MPSETSERAGLRACLAQAGLAPNRRLGQHFMVDRGALDLLVSALEAPAASQVIEVGPGTGILTRRLLAAGYRVLAVELDQGLARLLQQELVPQGLELVLGDCLDGKQAVHPAIAAAAGRGPWWLCANLPYDVSIPLILDCLALPQPPQRIVVTVQREAAERLVSRPGQPAWGASAAVAQAAGQGRLLRRLAPSSFDPPPRVESAILLWQTQRPLPNGFPVWCRRLFAYRRKVITRALRDTGLPLDAATRAVHAAGLDPSVRVEALAVEDLLRLQQLLSA